MSLISLPGTTSEPSPSTDASMRVRSESSMSVAASSTEPAVACSSTPPSTCTAPRVETARETTPSAPTSASFEHRSSRPLPTAMSDSIISLSQPFVAVHRECG